MAEKHGDDILTLTAETLLAAMDALNRRRFEMVLRRQVVGSQEFASWEHPIPFVVLHRTGWLTSSKSFHPLLPHIPFYNTGVIAQASSVRWV